MRLSTIAAVLAAASLTALASPPAQAQPFPSHMKNCQKNQPFRVEKSVYSVPAVGGGAGIVKVVAESFTCRNNETRNNESFDLLGMTDAAGKVIVPFKYEKVLPYSTTGAVVFDHGPGPYPKNRMYRTYTAGKGEGKERFDFQEALMLPPDPGSCSWSSPDTTPRGISAVIGELWFGLPGPGSDVTLFTPEGKPRKLVNVGGDDLKPAVERVGELLLARWRDDQGVVRSGILDLHGRQVAPVLGAASIWRSPKGAPGTVKQREPNCFDHLSSDLMIDGPSLDQDESRNFYGSLLTLVNRDGQPAAMPKGAIGLFPASGPRTTASIYGATAMWAVVFPTREGFEFTLHYGPPGAALIAAETAPRYKELGRMQVHGGLVGALAASDNKWRVFRLGPDILYGAPEADFDKAFTTAEAILDAEADRIQEANAAAWAKEEARRADSHKKQWEAARAAGRLCAYTVSRSNTRAEIEEYVLACGPGAQAGLAELVREVGISESTIQTAAASEWERAKQQAKARAEWEATVARNVNKDPMASYMPGQWESAIRNAGNAAVDAINQSSDNWLEQRRAQYNADWQRSQRAY